MTLRASIVWTPNAAVIPVRNCTLSNMIVGPTAVAGANNADPQFVNLTTNDFHVQGGSPARDAIDSGPPIDAAGTARPIGVRFDLGAFESQ
jgi:hypothetical protein